MLRQKSVRSTTFAWVRPPSFMRHGIMLSEDCQPQDLFPRGIMGYTSTTFWVARLFEGALSLPLEMFAKLQDPGDMPDMALQRLWDWCNV